MKKFQAAAKKCVTVSPHCPRELSSNATSRGQRREKREALSRACIPDLLIELKCLPRELLAHIQQYQVVPMRLPENACPLQAGGGINLDAVTT
jgi:hypothetical protein